MYFIWNTECIIHGEESGEVFRDTLCWRESTGSPDFLSDDKAEEEGGLRDRRLNFRRFRRFLRRGGRAQNPLESTARDPTMDPGVPGSPFARLSNRAGRAADVALHPSNEIFNVTSARWISASPSLSRKLVSLWRVFTRFVNTTEFLREENLLHTWISRGI